ncbi:hypothetical protein [Janibacter sp. HTCC2649]|uniref:hypothetical protein n=1 Tax=Janibacter sp. HTCC2649 TaxID=313589 RepID=UPI0011D1B5D6|nr:hypothetical protein [Janibacter sp. HTCC2649]
MSHNASDASDVAGVTRERVRLGLLVASFALLLVVGLSLPHAAAPDLGPRGWAPGHLLPFTLSPALVTATMWTAYTLGAAAIVLAVTGQGGRELPRPVVATLAVLAALATPFGSGDHVSYAAYGRILALGDNPWLQSPNTFHGGTDPVVSHVEAPWTEEPSVYGPFATLVQGLTSHGGGENLRQTVWLWQLIVIASWLAVRWALRRMLPGREGRIDAIWTANPLVFSVGVLGAHVDLLATALAILAVWAAHRYAGLGGAAVAGTFAALAVTSKFTYAVVLLALLLAFQHRRWARGGVLLGSTVVVVGALQLWAGPHVYDQIGRSAKAVALASPWRWFLEAFNGGATVRSLISTLAAVAAIGFAYCFFRLARPHRETTMGARALAWLVILTGAYALAASYSLPWYDVIVWAGLPAVSAAAVVVVDLVLLARLWVMSMAYTPGRVLGMTPAVEDLTMTVRTHVAPAVLLAVWVWLVRSAWRDGSRRQPAGRPAGSEPRR